MTKKSPIDQTKTLLCSFRSLHRLFGKWGHEIIVKSNLTMPQFWILQNLRSGEFTPQKVLAEKMRMSKSTLSISIEGLVTLGWVKRTIPEQNRREVQLSLTEEGEKKIQLIFEDPCGVYQRMNDVLTQIPQEKINTLLEIHHELYELLSQEHTLHQGGDNRC